MVGNNPGIPLFMDAIIGECPSPASKALQYFAFVCLLTEQHVAEQAQTKHRSFRHRVDTRVIVMWNRKEQ